MARDLNLSLLRVFAAVVDQGSMTAAARTLHLTQGAVSQQVARLEGVVGAKLLARDRSGLRLTPGGERLLGKARRILALNDEIWSDIREGAVDGIVRLGVPYDLVGTIMAPVLKAYTEAYPKVELSLICRASDDLVGMAGAGQLDLTVFEEPVGVGTGEELATDRLVWMGAKGGAAYLKSPLPLSLVAETCCFRNSVMGALEAQGRETRAIFEGGSLDATIAMVRMDLAVSAWLASTMPADLEILPPESGLPKLPSYAIRMLAPARPSSRAAQELARMIRLALIAPPRP